MGLELLKLALILGQALYWNWMRDETRDEIVWDACLYPGRQS